MRRICFVCLFLYLIATFSLSQSNPFSPINQSARVVSQVSASQADPKAQARILDSYGRLPLSFEANHGQADSRVKFLSRTGGYTVFLTADEAVLALSGKRAKKPAPKGASRFRGATVSLKRYPDTNPNPDANPNPATRQSKTSGVLRMKLRNSNPAAEISGTDELAGTSNYFIGNDPTQWRTNVPTYAKVKYEGIYSGIDLVYYGNQRQLEYDFIVSPGADPRRIAFDVSGAKRIRQDAHGDLVLKTGEDDIRWHRPVVYQEKDGARQLVAAHYAITDGNRVGFELAKYDANRPLYIDPLIYSTYLGGGLPDWGYGIAVDSSGSAYVTGLTGSTDFPTMNPLQPANGGGYNEIFDAFVSKLNPSGSALIYSTYLGGSGNDYGYGIAVDSAGNAYVAGQTTSTDFPTTSGAFQMTGPGGFAAKLNPTGSALGYSTYLDGSGPFGIAVDSAGNAYVTGSAGSGFPTTPGAFQTTPNGGGDAFVTKFNPSGSALVYSTLVGGSGTDVSYGIAVDSAGNAYVTGFTDSTNFPTTTGAFQTICCGAFVTKINSTGSALVYSTYLGGGAGYGITLDSSGNGYLTGSAGIGFPTTPGAFQTTCNGGSDCFDVFVTKLNATGSALVYSTYLGGSLNDWSYGIAVDSAGNAYITGYTYSLDFPTKNPLRGSKPSGYNDAFVAKFNPSGSVLVYSTYLGGSRQSEGSGIAVDSAGNAYITGRTDSTNFPTTTGAFQTICNDGIGCATFGDAFVTKLNILGATKTTLSSSTNPSTYGQAVTFIAIVTLNPGAPPDGETVTFKKGTTVLGTRTLSGGSASFTTSTLPVGTNYIKAVYGGDSNFASSTSKAVSQVVSKATTTTALTSSLNPSIVGQSVTFTASVTPQFSGTVKGSVTFYDGTTALKTVALSGGVAKFTTSTLTLGAHSITATYNGSAGFDASSASLTQTVN